MEERKLWNYTYQESYYVDSCEDYIVNSEKPSQNESEMVDKIYSSLV